jgi:hypothetical protein
VALAKNNKPDAESEAKEEKSVVEVGERQGSFQTPLVHRPFMWTEYGRVRLLLLRVPAQEAVRDFQFMEGRQKQPKKLMSKMTNKQL